MRGHLPWVAGDTSSQYSHIIKKSVPWHLHQICRHIIWGGLKILLVNESSMKGLGPVLPSVVRLHFKNLTMDTVPSVCACFWVRLWIWGWDKNRQTLPAYMLTSSAPFFQCFTFHNSQFSYRRSSRSRCHRCHLPFGPGFQIHSPRPSAWRMEPFMLLGWTAPQLCACSSLSSSLPLFFPMTACRIRPCLNPLRHHCGGVGVSLIEKRN